MKYTIGPHLPVFLTSSSKPSASSGLLICLSRTLAEASSQPAGLPSSRPSSTAKFSQGIHDHSYLAHISSYIPADCTSSRPPKPETPNFPMCRHHLDLHPELTAQFISLANPSSTSSALSDALTPLGQVHQCSLLGKELGIQAEGRACAKAWRCERPGRTSYKLAQSRRKYRNLKIN